MFVLANITGVHYLADSLVWLEVRYMASQTLQILVSLGNICAENRGVTVTSSGSITAIT
jgi:hypothetical protein